MENHFQIHVFWCDLTAKFLIVRRTFFMSSFDKIKNAVVMSNVENKRMCKRCFQCMYVFKSRFRFEINRQLFGLVDNSLECDKITRLFF